MYNLFWVVGVIMSQVLLFDFFYEEDGDPFNNFAIFMTLLILNCLVWWFLLPGFILYNLYLTLKKS